MLIAATITSCGKASPPTREATEMEPAVVVAVIAAEVEPAAAVVVEAAEVEPGTVVHEAAEVEPAAAVPEYNGNRDGADGCVG